MTRADVLDLANDMKAKGELFALATVVRTVAVTAAKAGAKAIIRPDGTISAGWIGGGCACGAVLRATREAIKDGEPRLVSVQPNELLERLGITAGEAREGIEFAKNMCPSQGTMDIFVEPVLPRPQIVVCGCSPVGVAVAELARQFGFFVLVRAPASDHAAFGEVDLLADGFELQNVNDGSGFISSRPKARGIARRSKRRSKHPRLRFHSSARAKKAEALRKELAEVGVDPGRLSAFKAPAGLDIGQSPPMKSRFRSWLKSLRRDGVGIDPNRRLPSRNRINALEMTGTQRIEATREEVYAALNDTEVLRQCIPGCETIEKLSDTQMRATMTLKVGPVKASFKGMITLSDLDPPNGYRITGEGSGGAAGFAKGGANVRLTAFGKLFGSSVASMLCLCLSGNACCLRCHVFAADATFQPRFARHFLQPITISSRRKMLEKCHPSARNLLTKT